MNLDRPLCQRHYTCQLLRRCFRFRPGSQSHKYVPMFEAYLDESGHPADSSVVTVAAVVSDEQGWHAFEDQWAHTLQQYEIATFHMTDYESRRGEFSKWGHHERKARNFIADLSVIFTNTLRFACVFSVAMEDWHAAMQVKFKDHRLKTVGPWLPLFLTCAESMYKTPLIPDQQKIAFWFEQNNLLKAPATEHFDKWKKAHGFADRLQSLTFSEKSTHLGFQAADLLAYEGRKYYQNRRIEGAKRDERKIHRALRKSGKIDERMFTRQRLTDYVRENHSPAVSVGTDAAPMVPACNSGKELS